MSPAGNEMDAPTCKRVSTTELIREISLANPLWGAPRIDGELLKLGNSAIIELMGSLLRRGKSPGNNLLSGSDALLHAKLRIPTKPPGYNGMMSPGIPE